MKKILANVNLLSLFLLRAGKNAALVHEAK